MEVIRDNLECNIYVDADEKLSTLKQNVAKLFYTDSVEDYIYVSQGDIYFYNNENYHKANKKNKEDGFLFYRYKLKVMPNNLLGRENAVEFIRKIIQYCWSLGYPAIAFCSYESELPNNGGYKSSNVPTPY